VRPWIERHKVIRRLLLAWAVWLITYVTLQLPWHGGNLSSGTAAGYATVVGLLSLVTGLYFHNRAKEDRQ